MSWWNKKEEPIRIIDVEQLKKDKDVTEDMLRTGKKISSLTNLELIALKNNSHIHNSTYNYVMQEYNYRLNKEEE